MTTEARPTGADAALAGPVGAFATGRGRRGARAEYVGDHLAVYCGHAADEEDRRRVASGGVVTTLLAHALREGLVDAVAACRSDFSGGEIGYRFDLLTEPDRIREYGTSAYFNIPLERHWREIDSYPGRVAVCALPCHVAAFRGRQREGRGLANVPLLIGLFCGHNNEPELLRFVLGRQGIAESDVADMRVDRTYLGGAIQFDLRDGSRRAFPFRDFNVYRSLWFFSKPLCRYCDDHLGASADVSVGDAFVPEYRGRPIKHSAIVARTPSGLALVEGALDAGALAADRADASLVYRAQKRVIVPSRDLGSRSLARRAAGFPAGRPGPGRFRLRSFLTYTLLHLNDRLSRAGWGRRVIAAAPRPLLYAYIAAIKLINNSLGPSR